MKLAFQFFIGVCAVGFCVGLAAGQAATSSPSSDFSEPQILQTWGWIIAHDAKSDHSEISDAELPAFLKGVAEGFKSAPCPYFYGKIIPDVRILAKARRGKYVRAVIERNQARANAFFAELDKNPNVVKLPSGLRYQIIKAGDGPCPKPQQTVNVHFLGHLLDGTEFTQFGPLDVVLWPNRVNPYLFEGIQKINKGGSIRLYVSSLPTEMEVATYGFQPGSTMVYEVELFDISQTPPDVLETTLAPDAPEAPPAPPSGYTQEQIIETWGWSTARKSPVGMMGFSDDELSMITTGLIAGVKGERSPYDLKKISPDIEKFIQDRREQARAAFEKKQNAETAAFFNNLKNNQNVVALPSGLCYEIIKPGSGPFPKPGQTVKFQFVGSLLNGKIFQHTFEGDPSSVILTESATNGVLPAWNEGLQKINKGGKIKLYVPPSLGYGAYGDNGAPPYSTLIFEIELVDIADTPPPDNSPPATQPAPGSENK